MTSRIFGIECTNPLDEALHPPLLKDAHQRRSKRLARIRRNLCNSGFWTTALLDITSCHLSELEVSCYVGRDEDVGQLAAGHEEFRNEVDIPVVDSSILLPWLLPLVVVPVFLEELVLVRYSSQIRGERHTVSILTEAASLLAVS